MTAVKNMIKAMMIVFAFIIAKPVKSQVNEMRFASIESYKKSKSVKTKLTQDTADNDGKESSTGYIGFRFMPTFTTLDLNADGAVVESSATLGYGYGGVLGFNFTDHFGMQLEVIYSSLAQRYTVRERENTIRLKYINVPLLFRFNTDYSKPVNFNVVLGPQLGLNVGSSVDADDANGAGVDTIQARVAVKKGDIGIAYGAGLDFGMGTSGSVRLNIGFRGVLGLVDISDRSNNRTTTEYYVLDRSKVKTYAGYIGLSFAF